MPKKSVAVPNPHFTEAGMRLIEKAAKAHFKSIEEANRDPVRGEN